MAKKNKITEEQSTEIPNESVESTEQEVQEVVLTEEQKLLAYALEHSDLASLEDDERVTEKLAMLITVYTSLLGVLGAESPATINAYNNLVGYTPDKVKKAKKEKAEKIPKFNEGKEIRAILGSDELDDAEKLDNLKALQGFDTVSEELKIAITTYVTLLGIEGIPVPAITSAQDVLLSWGKKSGKKSGQRGKITKQEPYGIVVDGDDSVVYKNRTEAVRALGYDKNTFVGESKISTELKAWQSITRGLHSEAGEATYDGHTFKRVDASLITEQPASE